MYADIWTNMGCKSMHTHTSGLPHRNTHTYRVQTNLHTHTHTHIHTHTHTKGGRICTKTHRNVQIRSHSPNQTHKKPHDEASSRCVHAHTHTHTHAHRHTHTHTDTHTYRHTHKETGISKDEWEIIETLLSVNKAADVLPTILVRSFTDYSHSVTCKHEANPDSALL